MKSEDSHNLLRSQLIVHVLVQMTQVHCLQHLLLAQIAYSILLVTNPRKPILGGIYPFVIIRYNKSHTYFDSEPYDCGLVQMPFGWFHPWKVLPCQKIPRECQIRI